MKTISLNCRCSTDYLFSKYLKCPFHRYSSNISSPCKCSRFYMCFCVINSTFLCFLYFVWWDRNVNSFHFESKRKNEKHFMQHTSMSLGLQTFSNIQFWLNQMKTFPTFNTFKVSGCHSSIALSAAVLFFRFIRSHSAHRLLKITIPERREKS